jgi:alkylation response protein AidB-like acyl-CoA dehydrogenase
MATEIEAARRLVYYAAWTLEMKKPGFKMHSSMAKLFASEVAQRVSEEAMQIHGGYGITKDFHIFPVFAGLRLATVTEGTSEIQKLIISRELGL